MTTTDQRPEPCYRAENGVYFTRLAHRHDCDEADCRGCKPCAGDHCGARKNCTWHIAAGELTCGRCIGGVRRELRWIGDLSALLPTQAMNDGTDSEAANLSGPAAHYPTFSARRRIAKRWIEDHLPFSRWEVAQADLLDDDDEHHPAAVLTRWEAMLREDYDQPTERITFGTALAYLDRHLHRIANDEGQDFPLLRAELKKCRQHIEAVLHNDTRPDRGAPCPSCVRETGKGAPLRREYAHWCDESDCERFHLTDDGSDVWRCPRNADHWWTQAGYADEVVADLMGQREEPVA